MTRIRGRWMWMAMALAAGCGDGPAATGPLDPVDPAHDPDAGTPAVPLEPGAIAPPITGGTMTLVEGGELAIIADVDLDRIVAVGIDARELTWSLPLGGGAHPFRIAEGPGAVAYVTLRATGEVLAVDVRTGTELGRRTVCGSPRGVAWDEAAGLWHVACADGALVSLRSIDEEPSRTLHLGVDLRDVVVSGDNVFVSRFRSAEVLVLDATGEVVETMVPPEAFPRMPDRALEGGLVGDLPGDTTVGEIDVSPDLSRPFVPNTAYRMRAMIGGGVALLHQRSSTNAIPISATEEPAPEEMPDGAYGGHTISGPGCGQRLVHAAVTVLVPSQPARTSNVIEEAVLPVDFAHDVSSDTFVLASAGGDAVFSVAVPLAEVTTEVAFPACDLGPPIISAPMPTAVEVRPGTGVLVFARTDQQLRRRDATIVRLSPYPLPEGTAFDGFFRRVGRAPMACATCHPEGAEDGHVWRFGGVGPRRTQTTAGNIVGTAPFHWSGDVPDMDVIIDTNMERMGRSPLDPRAPTLAFEALLETFAAPAPPRSADDASALAGRAVFDAAGCADCHSGDAGTNHLTLDVGTGEPFQVPHLIGVAHRAPFFHDGCAETLRAVLDGCETHAPDAHAPSSLTEADKDALVAYLESR